MCINKNTHVYTHMYVHNHICIYMKSNFKDEIDTTCFDYNFRKARGQWNSIASI